MYKKGFKGGNGKDTARHYDIYFIGDYIKASMVTFPPDMRYQMSYLLTKKRMSNDILLRRMFIKNYHYIEDVNISEKKLYMRSSGSRVDAVSIGYNVSDQWSWSPIIPIYSSSYFPITSTFLAYIEMNNFTYTIET